MGQQWTALLARFGAAVDWFIPRAAHDNPDEVRRSRLAVTMSWVTSACFVLAALGQAVAANRRAVAIDALLATLIFVAPFIGKRTGLKPVAHGLLLLCFI